MTAPPRKPFVANSDSLSDREVDSSVAEPECASLVFLYRRRPDLEGMRERDGRDSRKNTKNGATVTGNET